MRYVFFVLVFAFLLSGSVAGGYYYYYLIPEKVERKLLESVHALGFEAFSFGGIENDREKVTLRNVVLDKDGFSKIDEISIHFSLSQILFKSDQARSIYIKGLRITGEVNPADNALTFEGFGAQSAFLDNIKKLPARTIVLEDGRADIMTEPFGGVALNFSLQLNRQSDDSFNLVGRVASKQNKLAFHSKITGGITSAQQFNYAAEIEQLSLTRGALRVRRGTASMAYDSKRPSFYKTDVNLSSLVWNDLPLSNVTGSVNLEPSGFDAQLNGSTFGGDAIMWDGSFKLQDGQYSSSLTLKPDNLGAAFDFIHVSKNLDVKNPLPLMLAHLKNPEISVQATHTNDTTTGHLNLKFDQFTPTLSAAFSSKEGTDDIKGRFEKTALDVTTKNEQVVLPFSFDGAFNFSDFWGDGSLDVNLLARIDEGRIQYGPITLSDIEGMIPYGTQSEQQQISLLNFKLPLKSSIAHKGTLASSIHSPDGFEILKGVLSIYGGNVKIDAPVFKDNALMLKNTLSFSDINIAQLFADAGFNNIFISGALGGVIPIELNKDIIKASGGLLQSQSEGIIKIPSDVAASLFPGDSDRLKTIRSSLRNFHYEFFEIRLDGDLNGRVLMTLSARGRNPDLNDKEPIDLNLQIETQILTLFKKLLR